MAKTRRKIESSLKLVDIVAELVDSRIPLSSRNPVINSIVNSKARIILLNKADMADPRVTEKWVEFFASKKIRALPIDCKTGRGLNKMLPLCKEVLAEQIAAWNRKGMVGRPIRIMVVGVPNVGKSSLINKMCKGKAGKADVQDRPGVTRDNRWFTIGQGFELLDTPGVLWPKFEDPMVGQRLAFTGAVKDDVIDIEGLACKFLEDVTQLYPNAINNRYQTAITADMEGYQMLEAVGKKRGMLISGGI
ncbi:MAG: ribosome biogenesis GTPase YlqF, partial [Clostridia bacterium]